MVMTQEKVDPNVEQPGDEWMYITEACQKLGYSKKTLMKLIKRYNFEKRPGKGDTRKMYINGSAIERVLRP